MRRSTILFAVCVLVVAAGALAFRLPQLEKRPMHCDEANQAVRAGILLDEGRYHYDPVEHHGPILYWITVPLVRLGGAADFAHTSEFAFRLVPVLFGAGLILLVFLAADGLGRGPAVLASLLVAISPAMVYYSRYYVQEMLLVFFTFATIACAWRYVQSRAFGWAAATGASLGLMHATKETWVLAGAAMAIGLGLTLAWTRWRDGAAPAIRPYFRPLAVLVAVVAAAVVVVAFYTSFGTHWRGPIDSILAYETYWRRGTEPGIHSHPWHFYLGLLLWNRPMRGFFWTESFIVGLAALGAVAALFGWKCFRRSDSPGEDRGTPSLAFCRFLAFYTIALTALYAAVSYKTPWCMLSFLHGMILLAGVGAWAVVRSLPWVPLRIVACGLLIVGAAHLGRQSYALSYRFAADQRNPYVYAHTSGDVLNLAAQMERLAQASPEGHDMLIHVVTPENVWPLPWYLRRFNAKRVGYWQDIDAWSKEAASSGPPPSVIVLTEDVRPQVDAKLRAAYNQQITCGLRPGARGEPGVMLIVYVREDLWQAFVAQAAK